MEATNNTIKVFTEVLYFIFLLILPLICSVRKKMLSSSGTVPTASMFVDYPSNCVVVATRELTAPGNVKSRTGPAKVTDSVTSNGANVTSVVKRTSTGRSSPFQTKDSVSEPRN